MIPPTARPERRPRTTSPSCRPFSSGRPPSAPADRADLPGHPGRAPAHRRAGRRGRRRLGAFLESEADRYDYLLLSLVCSFRPSTDGAPFTDAGIGIRLEAPACRPTTSPSPGPLAEEAGRPRRPSGSLTLTANLVLVDAGVEYSPGGGGQEKLFVVGMGERDSDPEWRFTATPDTPLVGDESLA